MINEIARAFQSRGLSRVERELVRTAEASLGAAHLTLSVDDICKSLQTQPPAQINREEWSAMETLYKRFESGVLWKQRQIEGKRHPAGCTPTTCRHPLNPLDKTAAQEMDQWLNYSLTHYTIPQASGRSLDQTLAVTL